MNHYSIISFYIASPQDTYIPNAITKAVMCVKAKNYQRSALSYLITKTTLETGIQ